MSSEKSCKFLVVKKELRTLVAMLTEHKVTEIFFMADDFCKFFDQIVENIVLFMQRI